MRRRGPLKGQIALTKRVTAWYLSAYHRQPSDVGVAPMFCDPKRVGAFAISPEDLAAGRPEALYRLLSAVVMFQRRQDKQITAILRGISAAEARELSDAPTLLSLAQSSGCDLALSLASLKGQCDLAKDPSKRGVCGARPDIACAPKRHTVLLKRYGHFGKVPTSLALMVRESGASDLEDLYRRTISERSPTEAALELERVLTTAWRVSDKIAAMYLSMLTNSQLSSIPAPWADRVDSSRFVAVDSNVDLFLGALGYSGLKTYDARRSFIQALAEEIDLSKLRSELHPYNPRLVQQAMFMFMSASNRRVNSADCCAARPSSCAACPAAVSKICPLSV